jgi:hypothetical protein
MTTSLPVVNLATATFECVFGPGCDGIYRIGPEIR